LRVSMERFSSRNPAEVLPYEIFTHVLSMLSPTDLRNCLLCCRAWRVAADDGHVWVVQCRQLWSDKIYVPETIDAMRRTQPKLAYRESLIDAERQTITAEELCTFDWFFRFKTNAGADWIRTDPWHNSRPATRVRFHRDGLVRIHADNYPNYPAEELPAFLRIERRWQFVSSVSHRTGPAGFAVRVNQYPPYLVRRFKNWGFVMESCWVLYVSFPMPPKGACLDLEDAALRVTVRNMPTEAMLYNIGVQHPLELLQMFHHAGALFNFFEGDDSDDELPQDTDNPPAPEEQ